MAKPGSRPRKVGVAKPRTVADANDTNTRRQSPATHVRRRFERFWEWVEAGGVHVPGVQTTLFFWKRLGLKGVAAVVLIAGYPLGEYSLLSYAANSTLPRLAGDFGVTFEAEDWSYHPFRLKTVARHVRIRPKHDVRTDPIFSAAEIEFQGSVGSTLAGVWDLLRWRGFHTFNEVTIKHGEIHLERSLTGHLNWSEYADSIPAARRDEVLSGLYNISTVAFEDVKVNYVEHVRGNSGGGIIQTVQAHLFVDGIRGAITDIRQTDDAAMPTKIRLSGRSADGTVDLQGRLALGRDFAAAVSPQSQQPPIQNAAQQMATDNVTGAEYDLTLALNNIGAAAFARTMPPTRIMATSGTVSGKVALRHTQPVCVAEAAMHDVRFAPNPQLVPVRAEYDELQRLLKDRVVSKPYKACDAITPDEDRKAPPHDAPDPGRRASSANAAAFIAAFNEQANQDAPAPVRSAVALDSHSLVGRVVTAEFAEVTNGLTNQIASRLAGRLGIDVSGAGLKSNQQSENPVAKGVRGLGRGIKKLFGRGKNDQ